MMCKVIFSLFLFLSPLALFAEEIDPSYQKRIEDACNKSAKKNLEKMANIQLVCRCIAKTHYESAKQESLKVEGLSHIKWITSFYEEQKLKELEKMIRSQPQLSRFDDLVVDDCMSSAVKKAKGK